jgi:hypothetical protein
MVHQLGCGRWWVQQREKPLLLAPNLSAVQPFKCASPTAAPQTKPRCDSSSTAHAPRNGALLDAFDVVLASADPAALTVNYDAALGLGASVSAVVAGGSYYVKVDGVGFGLAASTGYPITAASVVPPSARPLRPAPPRQPHYASASNNHHRPATTTSSTTVARQLQPLHRLLPLHQLRRLSQPRRSPRPQRPRRPCRQP